MNNIEAEWDKHRQKKCKCQKKGVHLKYCHRQEKDDVRENEADNDLAKSKKMSLSQFQKICKLKETEKKSRRRRRETVKERRVAQLRFCKKTRKKKSRQLQPESKSVTQSREAINEVVRLTSQRTSMLRLPQLVLTVPLLTRKEEEERKNHQQNKRLR